ncbi:MAG: hypothetical protein MK135_17345 [Polyangiaceae bacterium]|nr:hypothetical protein [Polyangiaceae bacterium]
MFSLPTKYQLLMAGALLGCETEQEERTLPFELEILGSQACSSPQIKSNHDRKLFGYHVKIHSHRGMGVPASFHYASLVAEDGRRYLAEPVGCTPLLSERVLGQGDDAKGWLNFAMPEGTVPAELIYAPDLSHLKEKFQSQTPLQQGRSRFDKKRSTTDQVEDTSLNNKNSPRGERQ